MKLTIIFLFGVLSSLISASSFEPIKTLPGMTTSVSFKQYSGYVTVNETAGRNLFFWFVESQSDPTVDPLILWLTGGPGCSGIFALLTENGPFSVKDDGKTLKMNPYSWNREANVIYVEAPCGVGFSFSDDDNYVTGDNQTADDNVVFVQEFLKLFPQFSGNRFLIAGESYAGHYVPQLAQRLVDDTTVHLRGVMIGNPAMDHHYDGYGAFEFLAYHALIHQEFLQANQSCEGDIRHGNSKECIDRRNEILRELVYINPYNIYDECDGKPAVDGGCLTMHMMLGRDEGEDLGQTFVPCINISAVVTWMNQESVRKALHVSPKALSVWSPCSPIVKYRQYASTVLPELKYLIDKQIPVLIYSGDVDTCVPYIGTETAIESLGFQQTIKWERWFVDGQIAGYHKQYADILTFLTVKGSGHMVPMYKPKQAFEMFVDFIYDKPFDDKKE